MYIPNDAGIIKESTYGYHLIPIQDEMLSHREVELVGKVTPETVNALVRQLRYLQRQDPEGPITLYINSPGGSVASGMALYDVMQAVSCPIRTICVGLAASMAALLFISGGQRDMLPPQPPDDPRPAHPPDRGKPDRGRHQGEPAQAVREVPGGAGLYGDAP